MVTMAQARILVVDDDTSIRSFVEMALDSVGYAVSTAGNGAQALEVTDQVQPDLILLDMRMPVMSGVEFLRAREQHTRVRAIPVVIMSATNWSGQKAVGVADVLTKPAEPSRLLTLAARYCATDGNPPPTA